MSKLNHWLKALWIETQYADFPGAQSALVPFLHRAKETARMVVRPRIPLSQLSGCNAAGALTVTYGGLDFCKGLLTMMLFDPAPVETELSPLMAWQPGQLSLPDDSDLVILETNDAVIRKLPKHRTLTLPYRVQFDLDLRGEWETVQAHLHPRLQRNLKNALRGQNYALRISQHDADVEHWYQQMYLPTMHARHGKLAAILPSAEAHQLARHGGIYFAERDGKALAGMLCLHQGDTIEWREIGVLNGDTNLLKQEVIDINIYLVVRWAHQQRFAAMSWGDGWPFLSNNFIAKRKWGGTVSVSPHQHKKIWMHIRRVTPAVQHFFREHPSVILNGHRSLAGLIVVDQPHAVSAPELAALQKQYATPGLANLRVTSLTELLA